MAKPRKLSNKFLLKAGSGKRWGHRHMPHLWRVCGLKPLGARKAQIDFPQKRQRRPITCGDLPSKGMGEGKWLVTLDWY